MTDKNRVYLFDDGEQHWIVASGIPQAYELFFNLASGHEAMDVDGPYGDSVNVRRLPDDTPIVITLDEPTSIPRRRPGDCTEVDRDRYKATAEAWASTMPDGGLLCSSVW